MSRYRRENMPGATWFFTVVTFNRQRFLCDEPVRVALRNAIEQTRLNWPFYIDAWVLLPDHLHCIWTLPDGDTDFATRWNLIKRRTSKSVRTIKPYNPNESGDDDCVDLAGRFANGESVCKPYGGDNGVVRTMNLIKPYFDADLMNASKTARRELTFWQRRFWEHRIRDERDFEHHVDYIHYNPVKHGYAKTPSTWVYSSFHRYAKEGKYSSDWGVVAPDIPFTIGKE